MYNPLHFIEIKTNSGDYNAIEKILFNDLNEWCCPICFEDLNNIKLFVCVPFECNHLTCFNCFKKNCEYIRHTNKKPKEVLKCSLCRASTTEEWNNAYKIYYNDLDYRDHHIKFVGVKN